MGIAVAQNVQLEARLLPTNAHQLDAQLIDYGSVLNASVPEHPDLPRQGAPRLAGLVHKGLFWVVDDERVASLRVQGFLKE